MRWSFPIATVAGTVVRIHITFLLLLLWIGMAYGAKGGTSAAVDAVVYIVALFACVVAHEFGHVLTARRFGVKTPDITLFPIGGVASLERIPEKPSQEFLVAIAGPLVNVVIAGVLFLFVGGSPDFSQIAAPEAPAASLAERLMVVNLFLAVFNLIPAFPMDGGRVLRALLATRMPYPRATQIAASIGQGLAFLFGFLGLFGNPILIFIAIFIYLAAGAEAGAVQMREVSRGMTAADAMVTHFETLGPQSTVNDAAECLIRTTQREFPVVDGGGRLRGVLTRDAMILALRTGGPGTPVLEAMTGDIPLVSARSPLEEALKLMQQSSVPAVGVTDAEGRLIGLVTPENVGEIMMLYTARPDAIKQPGGPLSRRG